MKQTISQFISAMRQLGIEIPDDAIEVIEHGCPHAPRTLPAGKMAVYCFHAGEKFYKIGKAGPRINKRFQRDHYRTDARSSLAKSILGDVADCPSDVTKENIGDWIRNHLHRTDVLVDARLSIHALSLIEAYLICRLDPIYEGHTGQRKTRTEPQKRKTMPLADDVVQYLRGKPEGRCDACITRGLGRSEQQPVNAACRKMAKSGALQREMGLCNGGCPTAEKIVNRLP